VSKLRIAAETEPGGEYPGLSGELQNVQNDVLKLFAGVF
jgi:hypothetical protein